MAGHRRIDWRKAAMALGAVLPRTRFAPEVLAWTDRHRRGGTWHVALSGGADSVALLLAIWANWPNRRRKLRALHFDHRLRGAASAGDAEFCRRMCRSLRIPITVGYWRRPKEPKPPSEAAARAARFAFFALHARVLWFGHHQDDVAETMLMRLARGSGSGGLSAPRPVQEMSDGRIHLRPLLGLRKEELAKTLRSAGGAWREDKSNGAGRYFRNRVRRDVLPTWVAAAERDAIAGAARSRELLAEDDTALETWVDRVAPIDRRGELSLRRLAGLPKAVIRRSLHRWLLTCEPKIDISRQAFDALLESVVTGRPTRHSLGSAQFAVLRAGRLRLEKRG